jgi:hypothetical protein
VPVRQIGGIDKEAIHRALAKYEEHRARQKFRNSLALPIEQGGQISRRFVKRRIEIVEHSDRPGRRSRSDLLPNLIRRQTGKLEANKRPPVFRTPLLDLCREFVAERNLRDTHQREGKALLMRA